jgi:ppGpp synthetase/RelA/SpoT-type nucleotidyltranferase
MADLTASQVNKAGRLLRTWWANPTLVPREVYSAFDVLNEYRAAHSRPLIKATNGLRSMVRSEHCTVEVSQRLKRMNTILEKLCRHPTMALSTMQDIGGCRAIVANIDELRRVERRVARTRPPVRIDDYVAAPRSSGYRAIHLIVQYDARCIEIQLRTRLMHDWAVAVERFGGRMGEDLKSGRGPTEVLEWLELVAEALAIEDAGEVVDSIFMDRIRDLRKHALPYISQGGARS